MAGGSYGGGIQLVTAAIDCRIDAIAPSIAWNSLRTSLYKAETVKRAGRAPLRGRARALARPAHHVRVQQGTRPATLDGRRPSWFVARGPGALVERSRRRRCSPGHGRHALHARRGGHELRDPARTTACRPRCSGMRRPRRVPHRRPATRPPGAATLGWLDALREGRRARSTPARASVRRPERRALHGRRLAARRRARRSPRPGAGTLTLTADGGSGPAHATGTRGRRSARIVGCRSRRRRRPTRSTCRSARRAATLVVGAPKLHLTYLGQHRPARVRPGCSPSSSTTRRAWCSATRSRRSR